MKVDLTAEVKAYAKELGADVVGISSIERFKNAPLRMSPQGLLPQARSVIVCGIHHPDAIIELDGEPTPHFYGPYDFQGSVMNPQLDDISFKLAVFLEKRGFNSVPIVSSNIWRYKGYKDFKLHFAPDIAHRYAAVAAGLGEIGWSGLFLHPEFGPRIRLVTVITEAELVPDPLYDGEALCDRCMECVKNCPTDAFRKEVSRINEIEIAGKIFKFPDINKWRCGWSENFSLNLAHKIPDKVDEDVILRYIKKYGMFGGEMGSCLRFCMVPQKRYYDKDYSRAPRRKKEKKRIDIEDIKAIAERYLLDQLCIGKVDLFKDDFLVDPSLYLPDVLSVISIGVDLSKVEDQELIRYIERRLLPYASFDIAHYFDMKGFSAIAGTRIDNNLVARKLGVYEPCMTYSTILVSAELPQISITGSSADGRLQVWAEREEKREVEKEEFRDFCYKAGADLVGFFSIDRFDSFKRAFEENVRLPEKIDRVYDYRNSYYEPYSPVIKREQVRLKGPEDYLKGARSVIVIGLHFPDSVVDTAKVTPAESIGPYAFCQFEALNLLTDIAYRIIKRLNKLGYRASYSYDLTGLSSCVLSSRGLLPDLRANSYAAILSGVASVGRNGIAMTKEFGPRQRFLSIITDLPFASDPLYSGEDFCKGCDVCMKSCPAGAIEDREVTIRLEGKVFRVPSIDNFACDWAKRYGLIGEEGPKYMGADVDFRVPDKKSADTLAQTLMKVDIGVQKRHLNICEECIRTCVYKGDKDGSRT